MKGQKKFIRPKKSFKAGLPAGSLKAITAPVSEKSQLSLYIYDKNSFEKYENTDLLTILNKIQEIKNSDLHKNLTVWLNIDGHGEPQTLKTICDTFEIHPLVLEDIITTGQRPKAENYDRYSYIVLQSITACSDNGHSALNNNHNDVLYDIEQISLILAKNFVLSFQEKEGDAFKNIAQRLDNNSSKLRNSGADFLAYTIIDFIVDKYFSILENFGDQLDRTETKVVQTPSKEILNELYLLKHTALELRRSIWPLRELVLNLERLENAFITESTKPYIRDIYSHTIEIIDSLEIYREMLAGLIDLYLSSMNNKLNEVMKVLTVITTIFMPLTLLSSIYGMNFKYMPELEFKYAYPVLMAIMIILTLGMLRYFRYKRWI